MKITLSPTIKYNNGIYNRSRVSNPIETCDERPNQLQSLSGCEVPFCAMHKIKPRQMDTLSEKFKLARQIKDVLDELQKSSPEQVCNVVFKKHESALRKVIQRSIENSLKKASIEDLLNMRSGILEDSKDAILAICKRVDSEVTQLSEELKLKDKNDYELLSKLHSAVLSDNLDLDKVYKEHYAPLAKIASIPELSRSFPKLGFPPHPRKVIGKKVAGLFNRDMFMKFDDLRENHSIKEAHKYFEDMFAELIKKLATESKVDESFLGNALKRSTYKEFLKSYFARIDSHGLNSIPQEIRIPRNFINADEIKLLSIDYDKFVLNVLNQQYLGDKKLSEIVYREGDTVIDAKALNRCGYKFEKPSEKIKSFIKKAREIKQAERNYELFDDNQLQKILMSHGNREIANNEEILDRLIRFSETQFVEGDRTPLIKFLRVLDDISDGKITTEEGAKLIKLEDLRPRGTDSLNEAEKQKLLAELKRSQQKDAEFRTYCHGFDEVVDLLYRSEMEDVATLCTTYRPYGVGDSREFSDRIMALVRSGMKDGAFINKKQTQMQLKHLNTYLRYKTVDSESPILKKAIEFARDSKGNIDDVKAGHYITSYETISQQPASKSLYKPFEGNILDIIFKEGAESEEAIRNLMKFDEYRILPSDEKFKITTIQRYLDMNASSMEKDLLEAIVNDVYVKHSTSIPTFLNQEQNTTVTSELLPSAKLQILEEQNFPLCLKYFETFEKYMTRVGRSKDDCGIQIIGTNNKELRKFYKQEVKIPMEERLYSTKGNFEFDVYKSGLHKSKNTKA